MLVLGASAACEVAPAGATTRPAVVEAAAADGGMVFDGRRGLYLEDGGRRTKLPRGAWAGAYWSPNGKLFAYITAKDGRNILGVVDRRGSRRPLVSVPRSGRLGNPSSFAHVSWAPDSRRLAYTREVPLGGTSHNYLFTVSLDGGGETRFPLPLDASWDGPLWAPQDDVIAIRGVATPPSGPCCDQGIWLAQGDGAAPPQRLLRAPLGAGTAPVAWAPDGRKLAVLVDPRGLYVVNVATGAATSVSRRVPSEVDWAPDSRRLALTVEVGRGRGLRDDVRIARADGGRLMDAARTPKPLMDYRPVWSPDGRRLAFTRNLSGSATLGKTPQQIERQFHANPRRTMIVRASGGRPHELRRSASLIDWR